MPLATPEKIEVTPYTAPSPMCFGFFYLIFSRYSRYSSSMQRDEIPLESDPVILLTELNAPAMVFLISEEAPCMMPKPPSRGPLTNPSAGF